MVKKKKPRKRPAAKKTAKKKPPSKIKATTALAAFLEDAKHTWKLPAAVGGVILKSLGDEKSVDARVSEVKESVKAGEISMVVIDHILRSNPEIEAHLDSLYGMMLCRLVDNFETYISEILTEIYSNYPDRLVHSDIRLTPDNVFSAKNLEELRGRVIERHVQGVLYGNLGKYVDKLAQPNQLGFKLFPNKNAVIFASDFFQVRHLLVHNRGVINHTFLERVKTFKNPQLGQRMKMDPKYLDMAMTFVLYHASKIDKRAVQNFNLETPVALKNK